MSERELESEMSRNAFLVNILCKCNINFKRYNGKKLLKKSSEEIICTGPVFEEISVHSLYIYISVY